MPLRLSPEHSTQMRTLISLPTILVPMALCDDPSPHGVMTPLGLGGVRPRTSIEPVKVSASLRTLFREPHAWVRDLACRWSAAGCLPAKVSGRAEDRWQKREGSMAWTYYVHHSHYPPPSAEWRTHESVSGALLRRWSGSEAGCIEQRGRKRRCAWKNRY
ncbi:hypothetical protein C8Q76DRAFT_703011 [Earliella scabrosa]|nr:hypothetical protein C8Q76DRAFT_703011 [Earliella scabrosa]